MKSIIFKKGDEKTNYLLKSKINYEDKDEDPQSIKSKNNFLNLSILKHIWSSSFYKHYDKILLSIKVGSEEDIWEHLQMLASSRTDQVLDSCPCHVSIFSHEQMSPYLYDPSTQLTYSSIVRVRAQLTCIPLTLGLLPLSTFHYRYASKSHCHIWTVRKTKITKKVTPGPGTFIGFKSLTFSPILIDFLDFINSLSYDPGPGTLLMSYFNFYALLAMLYDGAESDTLLYPFTCSYCPGPTLYFILGEWSLAVLGRDQLGALSLKFALCS